MGDRSYAEIINSVKVMTSGLKSNADGVSKRGWSQAFTDRLSDLCQKAMTLDNEQEALKAKLKTKTAELDGAMGEIGEMMSEAKKVVKLAVAQTNWKEFGISASK